MYVCVHIGIRVDFHQLCSHPVYKQTDIDHTRLNCCDLLGKH